MMLVMMMLSMMMLSIMIVMMANTFHLLKAFGMLFHPRFWNLEQAAIIWMVECQDVECHYPGHCHTYPHRPQTADSLVTCPPQRQPYSEENLNPIKDNVVNELSLGCYPFEDVVKHDCEGYGDGCCQHRASYRLDILMLYPHNHRKDNHRVENEFQRNIRFLFFLQDQIISHQVGDQA